MTANTRIGTYPRRATAAHSTPPRCQQGMALVLVLWLVVLLSILATGHARNARTEAQLASGHINAAKARALAEGGAHRAILELLMPANEQQWPVDGTVRSFELDGHAVAVAIRNATGLVDLNSASSGVIAALISSAEPDEKSQQRIVDAILDWRDADDLTHLHGAEDDDYRAAGLTWTARDGDFASVDELQYVVGMTRAIFDRIAPYLTVYSKRAGVDLEYAPPSLITALTGREIEAAEDRASGRAQATGQRRNGTFHVYVSASVGDRATFSLETVVRLFSEPEHPYGVLYWRETMRTPFPVPQRTST